MYWSPECIGQVVAARTDLEHAAVDVFPLPADVSGFGGLLCLGSRFGLW